jgi:hypothetical protein
MVLRRVVAAALIAATAVLTGCGVYADSNGQACVIIVGIPICQGTS